MRAGLLSALAAMAGFGVALLVGGSSSFGAQQSVSATPSNTFTPSSVTIAVGDTVTWQNQGGFHNVHFSDGWEDPANPGSPADPEWMNGVSRTFDSAGTFTYLCEAHGGMTGTVTVQAASSTGTGTGTGTGTTTTPTPTGTETTPAGTGTDTTGTGTGTTTTPPPGGGTDTGTGTTTTPDSGSPPDSTETGESRDAPKGVPPRPAIRSARLARKRFCARRAPSCPRPGVRFAVRLDAAATLKARLERRPAGRRAYRAFGTVRFGRLAPGRHALAFRRTASRRTLLPGRYRMTLEANGVQQHVLKFTVV